MSFLKALSLLFFIGFCPRLIHATKTDAIFQMDPMKLEQQTIGMIGGTSWESTLLYYELINKAVHNRLGNLNSAKILLNSINYDPIVHLEVEGKWDEVGKEIAHAAKVLEDAGADFVILCCNTLHKVTPSIEAAIQIPFLHIADAAGEVLQEQKIQKIGLLGTQFTMEDGFYSSRLESKFGLEVITPSLTERKTLDHIIYKELCQGKILEESKEAILQMIQNLQEEGAEAILLGCTELGMIVSQDDASLPLYDTTVLHAEKAVAMSFKTTKGISLASDYQKNSTFQWKWALDSLNSFSLDPKDHILDVGCGDGKISAYIAEKVSQGSVIGLDISPKMLQNAKEHFSLQNLQFIEGDAASLPYEEEFDKIVCFSTLHWIVDQKQALSSFKKSLKPNGLMLLVVPGKTKSNLGIISERLAKSKKWAEYFPNFKSGRIYYDPEEYRALLVNAGFTIESFEVSETITIFKDKAALAKDVKPCVTFTHHLPISLQEEFLEDILKEQIAGCDGMNPDGSFGIKTVKMEIIAKNEL